MGTARWTAIGLLLLTCGFGCVRKSCYPGFAAARREYSLYLAPEGDATLYATCATCRPHRLSPEDGGFPAQFLRVHEELVRLGRESRLFSRGLFVHVPRDQSVAGFMRGLDAASWVGRNADVVIDSTEFVAGLRCSYRTDYELLASQWLVVECLRDTVRLVLRGDTVYRGGYDEGYGAFIPVRPLSTQGAAPPGRRGLSVYGVSGRLTVRASAKVQSQPVSSAGITAAPRIVCYPGLALSNLHHVVHQLVSRGHPKLFFVWSGTQ